MIGIAINTATTNARHLIYLIIVNIVTQLLKTIRQLLAKFVLKFGLSHIKHARVKLVFDGSTGLGFGALFLEGSLSKIDQFELDEGMHSSKTLGNFQIIWHF